MNKKEFWNDRASLKQMAGTNDLIMKKLEMIEIAKYIEPDDIILDFGCGNGTTMFYLAQKFPNIKITGVDFSEKMIEEAQKECQQLHLEDRLDFMVLDHSQLSQLPIKNYSKVYSERSIINLDSWDLQKQTIYTLITLLKENGTYIMCESNLDGLHKINELRKIFSLPEITPPWHNCYITDKNIDELTKQTDKLRLKEINHFSSTYYFLSRVINAKLASDKGEAPSYEAEINKLALELPPINNCGQGKIWVWEKA